jgi:cAMP phosphodiesterase
MTTEKKINDVIARTYVIATLKGMEVDGETTQYILNKIGMDEQMLRQLIMTFPIEAVQLLVDEKMGFEKGIDKLTRDQLQEPDSKLV